METCKARMLQSLDALSSFQLTAFPAAQCILVPAQFCYWLASSWQGRAAQPRHSSSWLLSLCLCYLTHYIYTSQICITELCFPWDLQALWMVWLPLGKLVDITVTQTSEYLSWIHNFRLDNLQNVLSELFLRLFLFWGLKCSSGTPVGPPGNSREETTNSALIHRNSRAFVQGQKAATEGAGIRVCGSGFRCPLLWVFSFHCLLLPPGHRETTKFTAPSSAPIYLALLSAWDAEGSGQTLFKIAKEMTFIYAE